MKALVLFIFIASVALCSLAIAEDWVIHTVDNEGDIGADTKLWYDSQGQPNILYVSTSQQLFHTLWTGAGWVRTLVDGFVAPGTVDMITKGTDTVYYSGGSDQYARCGMWDGNSWSVLLSEYHKISNSAIALDTMDHLYIFIVHNTGPSQIEYRYQDSLGIWQFSSVPGTDDVKRDDDISCAINENNNIYVVYKTTTGNLKLAYSNGTNWGTQYIDESSDNVGDYCRIILDSSDVPHIVYYDVTNTCLKYATWEPAASAKTHDNHRQ